MSFDVFSLTTEELNSCPELILMPSHWNPETKRCRCVEGDEEEEE